MTSVLVVEGHAIFSAGLEAVLIQDHHFEVLRRCDTISGAVELKQELSPDLIVLDKDLCGRHLAAAVQQLSCGNSSGRIILLLPYATMGLLNEALSAGVHGLLLKTSAAEALIECARQVLCGWRWIDPILLEILSGRATQTHMASSLTSREQDITCHVARGLRNKEIAQVLAVSEATVKMHLHHIYDKLHLSGRTALALAAYSGKHFGPPSATSLESSLGGTVVGRSAIGK
jgi:two-component system nitrate/nitrite response regulator NarL